MVKTSAGLLMYKYDNKGELRVLIAHPGGPFWKGKDLDSWDIPKGQVKEGEDLLEAAKREFKEEIGIEAEGEFIDLGDIKRKDGSVVQIFAIKGEWNGLLMGSSYVSMEYPKGSGKIIKFPEMDKADFYTIEEARNKLYPSIKVFLDRLEEKLNN
jgi:predicted NUDIX family NTP pyrophosphohydrolase